MSRSNSTVALIFAIVFAVTGASILIFSALEFIEPANANEEQVFKPIVVGTVFTIAGLTVASLLVRRRRLIAYLLRHGLRLEGSVVGFERRTRRSTTANRSHATTNVVWYVLVDWIDQTGQKRRERSRELNEDPAKRFSGEDNVPVLVDPKNPRRFWIDLFGESNSTSSGSSPAAKKPVIRR